MSPTTSKQQEVERKVIVLAGNRQQFENYLNENGLTDSQAVYGWCADVLRGIVAKEVVEVGTFYERKDAHDLRREAEYRIRLPLRVC